MITEIARAKVNLCLHVIGRRGDGLHLLDSLVVFPDLGDRIEVAGAAAARFTIGGPFAAGLAAGTDNLVSRAAALCGGGPLRIHLHKALPVAAGIGGGSADAAATLRAIARLRRTPLPEAAQVLALGADVPVCLAQVPVRMSGIGETLTPLPALPRFGIVLVNNGVPVSTQAVFAALDKRDNPPLALLPEGFDDAAGLFDWLGGQRNDLTAAACKVAPSVAQVLDAISVTPDCALARMSGSGGTCFGLFPDLAKAARAAQILQEDHPDWWVTAART